MGEGALPLAFCQMSRTPTRIARMPMPRHAGEGVSAAAEMPSRVLNPMVRAVERMRATTQGRTRRGKLRPGVLEQVVDEGCDEQDDEKDGRTTTQRGAERPAPACDRHR